MFSAALSYTIRSDARKINGTLTKITMHSMDGMLYCFEDSTLQ